MIFQFLKTSYQNVHNALAKTGSILGNRIKGLFSGKVDEDTMDKLEQLFFEADLGVQTSMELVKKVEDMYKGDPNIQPDRIIEEIKKYVLEIFRQQPTEIKEADSAPTVILIVGVNGNGKTTSVAKLAKRFTDAGKKVLISAADTFRAAAIEQLEIWAQRLQADIVKGKPKSDPSAVVFDSISAAKARNSDLVLIDTAGRLHTKLDLMQELEKIRRTSAKACPNSPHETLLVLDATSGQNAIDQAKIFNKYTPITGLILTKLDGRAKGGVVLNIQRQLGIPVKFIGIGESAEDLIPFEAESFVNALFE